MDRATIGYAPYVLPLLLAACGGGADGTATPTATVTAATAMSSSAADVRAALAAPTAQPNPDGSALTVAAAGGIDHANAFFKPLGNGRSCASCHGEAEGWTITPAALAQRFADSNGTDPVFRPVDGANSPLAPVGTLDQKRLAYSMLLTKGLIRVGLPIPSGAEFTLTRADDPYHYASAKELSLFRRPLPSANLKFASQVMWDGRETFTDAASADCILNLRPALCFASVDADLLHQANSAARGHAEAAQDLSAAEQRSIVDFEKGLTHAQSTARAAGSLTDAGALGGPANLARTNFYFGINDVQDGDYRTRAPFNRNVMTMFGAWRNLAAPPRPGQPAPSAQNLARASIARGEQIFNNRLFNVVNVPGFTDTLRVTLQRATCASCHDAPNAGSHSVPRFFNTGLSDAVRRTPDLPLYTLRNNATGERIDTTDPGQALVTGKWRDIGKVKTPNLRGLAARAPYFHNGSAERIEDVVRFYDRRFRMGLNPQEAADLAAFLKAL
ncbi:MAG TPA: cytochrome C [Telluria sp.]|nr:cytochrome C [Telluria sp.]